MADEVLTKAEAEAVESLRKYIEDDDAHLPFFHAETLLAIITRLTAKSRVPGELTAAEMRKRAAEKAESRGCFGLAGAIRALPLTAPPEESR